MLNCIINIKLTQLTPYMGMVRSETYTFDHCHSLEVYSTWKNLSDTATIEFPKNIYVNDSNNSRIIWGESATADKVTGYVNAGGFQGDQVNGAPLFMRGDEICIMAGYSYISSVNDNGSLQYKTTTNTLFHGFISSVESKSTLKIHCEDYMWLLKQTTMPTKTYMAPNNDISDVLNDMVAASNQVNSKYPIKASTAGFTLSIDGLSVGSETAADVLDKLKKILPSMAFYFRKNELRGGGIVYYPADQHSTGTGHDGKLTYNTFNFQKNIISDALQYSLQSDVKVAAICYSVNSKKDKTTNKMGAAQYSTCRLQTTVGVPKGANANAYEYFNFYFKDVTDTNALQSQGQTYLNRYQYNGYRGKFTTFGLPFVQHGNIISVTDSILPERNGNYIVKGVHYTYSTGGGLRQDIELHFRTNDVPQDILEQAM